MLKTRRVEMERGALATASIPRRVMCTVRHAATHADVGLPPFGGREDGPRPRGRSLHGRSRAVRPRTTVGCTRCERLDLIRGVPASHGCRAACARHHCVARRLYTLH
jgi:hypothetical protein